MNDLLDELVHRADLDGLIRLVDGWSATGDWAGLLTVRDRTRAALATGRQLWPVATLAEYRLALHAPAEWAGRVLDEASGRFAIGPLSEVAAQGHTAADLRRWIEDPIRFGFVAHERALRGEPSELDVNPLDIPTTLQPWEPAYPLATYGDDGVDAPAPPPPSRPANLVELSPQAARIDDPEVGAATRQLFDGWTAASTGRVEVACVEGAMLDAVAALGVRRAGLTRLGLVDALAWLGWAGAGGGAHGRRRGAATGRFDAWWLLAQLTDLADPWPPDPTELGRAGQALRWSWWDAGEPLLGWTVQLAVEDPVAGYAWAIGAHDAS